MSTFHLSDLLPEHRPRTVVGGTYRVRRPVAKLGRNDPCHCGSGKKYKKCSYAKDQELLRDASQYAGTTRTSLKAKPGLVYDPNVVLDRRAHELKQLAPTARSEGQLHSGYQRALAFGLRELAFEMLLEWERRAKEEAFEPGHFDDLIEDVLQAGYLDLARRIRDRCGDRAWWRPQAIAFRFDLLEHPERFEPLERDCRAAVCEVSDEEIELDEPLTRLAHDFAPRHPALAIAFARAAIASHPDRLFDNEMLLDVIRDARVDLNLAPDSDPQVLYDHLVEQLATLGMAHLHVLQRETGGARAPEDAVQPFDYDALHERSNGCWMVNNGYDPSDAEQALSNDKADPVAFGRPFISNPDLVRRLREDAQLSLLQEDKLYGGGVEGHTDYPTLDATG